MQNTRIKSLLMTYFQMLIFYLNVEKTWEILCTEQQESLCIQTFLEQDLAEANSTPLACPVTSI